MSTKCENGLPYMKLQQSDETYTTDGKYYDWLLFILFPFC